MTKERGTPPKKAKISTQQRCARGDAALLFCNHTTTQLVDYADDQCAEKSEPPDDQRVILPAETETI